MHPAIKGKVDADIASVGRSIIGVFPDSKSKDPTNEAFAYTIGNALKGSPELLVIGLWRDVFWLNDMSDQMIERGRAFDDGEIVNIGGPVSAVVVDASDAAKKRYTVQATAYLLRPYRLMQVVVPDKAGLFPWQKGCAKPYCDVVVHRARALQ